MVAQQDSTAVEAVEQLARRTSSSTADCASPNLPPFRVLRAVNSGTVGREHVCPSTRERRHATRRPPRNALPGLASVLIPRHNSG